MDLKNFSETEAQQLQGKYVSMMADGQYPPRGPRGRISGKRSSGDQGFVVLVNWEVNPMFVTHVPVQAIYSKAEFSFIRVID